MQPSIPHASMASECSFRTAYQHARRLDTWRRTWKHFRGTSKGIAAARCGCGRPRSRLRSPRIHSTDFVRPWGKVGKGYVCTSLSRSTIEISRHGDATERITADLSTGTIGMSTVRTCIIANSTLWLSGSRQYGGGLSKVTPRACLRRPHT